MLIKTMTQYANEAWESRLVLHSFVSPAEVFMEAGRVLLDLTKNPHKLAKLSSRRDPWLF